MPRVNSNSPKVWDLVSDKKVWTSTYWPYANHARSAGGNPEENLWADKGPLDKFDSVLSKRGMTSGAKAFEKTPALNYLADPSSPSGFYIRKPTIREADAERTTGVDFTGNGKLGRNIKRDFLDEFGGFGTNGKKDGEMDVSWWGSCDAVALAGMIFEEPTQSVTIEGVTFTPNDIKGLLVVTAGSQTGREDFVGSRYDGNPDQVNLKDGTMISGTIQGMELRDFRTGDFEHNAGYVIKNDVSKTVKIEDSDGKVHTVKAADVDYIVREDKESLSPALFHKTVKAWLRQNRPFAMDHDPGSHVWNDNYDHATIKKTRVLPDWMKTDELNGHNGPYSGGKLAFYETQLFKKDDPEQSYGYWIEKKGQKIVNSGWVNDRDYDENPDFMWRGSSGKKPTFTGDNERNPFVLPSLVKEIYEKSIA